MWFIATVDGTGPCGNGDSPRVFPGLTEFMLNKEVPLLMEKAKIDNVFCVGVIQLK